MGVLIEGMEMPKNCMECQWYYFQNSTCTDPVYYLDSRCKLIPPGQDWYGYDGNGGWIGEDIDQENKRGYYYYHHCVEKGKRAKQCPLVSVPEPHGRLIDEDALHKLFEDQWHYLQVLDWNENPTAEATQSGINWCINTMHDDAPTVIPASKEAE